MTCRAAPKQGPCPPRPSCPERPRGKPFHICLPFGASLSYDGEVLRYRPPEPGAVPPDGSAGLAVVRGGCLDAIAQAPLPVLTPQPCSPVPEPCGGEGGDVAIAPGQDNLLARDSLGRLAARLSVEAGDGVTASGSGSPSDPLRISSAIEPNDTKVASGTPDVLPIGGDGTEGDPYTLSHAKPSGWQGGVSMGGFDVDAYGHVTKWKEPSLPGVMGVQVAEPLVNNGTASVPVLALAAMRSVPLVLSLDGWDVVVDLYGRVASATETARLPEGAAFRAYDGSREVMDITFRALSAGRLRASYRGDLGPLALPDGLASPPSGLEAATGLGPAGCLAVVASGRIAGLEISTIDSLPPGDHGLRVSLPAPVSAPGLLDVWLCQ